MRLGLALAAAACLGAGPGAWRHPQPGETPNGEAEDLSVSASGSILLAPASEELLPGSEGHAAPSFLWAVEPDVGDSTFVGGGLAAQVIRIDGKGEVHAVFETTGVGVRALSSDIAGNLLVATMPNGRLYRIAESGSPEVLAEPEERYLWAMATDAFDRTYLATGERGIIYTVSGPGEAGVFFDSDEPHITALATDPTGRLLAGSAGRGLLYRIDAGGAATVILGSGLDEISSIAVASDGTVYASAILDPGPYRPSRRTDGRSELTIELTPEDDEEVLEEAAEPRQKVVIDLAEFLPAREDQERRPVSKVYRVSPGRTPSIVWTSMTERAYALSLDARGHLLVGTGPSGRLYRVEPDGSATLVRRFPAAHVTSLASGSRGDTWVLTSNPGRVYRLGGATVESGKYLSPVHDAGNVAAWGTIRWDEDLPKGTRIALAARSGNTQVPDGTWTPWSDPISEPGGSALGLAPARYVQWRASLSRLRTETSPVLRQVSLTYLPENLAPLVSGVRVSEPGKKPALDKEPAQDPEEPREPVRGEEARWLWISWRSSDPDGDPLSHRISILRGEGSAWVLLAEGVKERRIALDPAGHPEGAYVAKIEADDVEVNGPARGITASARSAAFVIDNTPPRIEAAEPTYTESSLSLEFQGADDLSPLARAEWSKGPDGPWTILLPDDGIADSASEGFSLALPLEGLGREIRLRLTDAAGNAATRDIALHGSPER